MEVLENVGQFIPQSILDQVLKVVGTEGKMLFNLSYAIALYCTRYTKCIEVAEESLAFKTLCGSIVLLVTMNVFWSFYSLAAARDMAYAMGTTQVSRTLLQSSKAVKDTLHQFIKDRVEDAKISTTKSEKAMLLTKDAMLLFDITKEIGTITEKANDISSGAVFSYLISTTSATIGRDLIKQIETTEANKIKSWTDYLSILPIKQQEITVENMKTVFDNIHKIDLVNATEVSLQLLNVTTEFMEKLTLGDEVIDTSKVSFVDILKPLKQPLVATQNVYKVLNEAPVKIFDNFNNFLYSTNSVILKRVFGNQEKLDILKEDLVHISSRTNKMLAADWNENIYKASENFQYAINPTAIFENEWLNQPLIPFGEPIKTPFIGATSVQVSVTNGTTISIVLLLIWSVIIFVLDKRRQRRARQRGENQLLQ